MTSPLFIAHWFVASVPSSRVAKIVDLLLYTSNWHLKSGTTGTGSYRPFFLRGKIVFIFPPLLLSFGFVIYLLTRNV